MNNRTELVFAGWLLCATPSPSRPLLIQWHTVDVGERGNLLTISIHQPGDWLFRSTLLATCTAPSSRPVSCQFHYSPRLPTRFIHNPTEPNIVGRWEISSHDTPLRFVVNKNISLIGFHYINSLIETWETRRADVNDRKKNTRNSVANAESRSIYFYNCCLNFELEMCQYRFCKSIAYKSTSITLCFRTFKNNGYQIFY